MFKLRVLFRKTDRLKFISHLELMKTVERAFRRLKLPLAFSKGFNPHIKMNFAMPLSVGVSSDYELLEVELTEKIDPKDFILRASETLPHGLEFIDAKYTKTKDSLMSQVSRAKYALHFRVDDVDAYKDMISKAMDSDEVNIVKLNKKKKEVTKNIRPLVYGYEYLNIIDNEVFISMIVACGSNGNLKPDDFIKAVSGKILDEKSIRVHRLKLYGNIDGVEKPLFEM